MACSAHCTVHWLIGWMAPVLNWDEIWGNVLLHLVITILVTYQWSHFCITFINLLFAADISLQNSHILGMLFSVSLAQEKAQAMTIAEIEYFVSLAPTISLCSESVKLCLHPIVTLPLYILHSWTISQSSFLQVREGETIQCTSVSLLWHFSFMGDSRVTRLIKPFRTSTH